MFHIDIGLPVFFYFDVAVTHHPEEVKIKQSIIKKTIFHYCNMMKHLIKKNIKLTLTFCGSEGEKSENFVKELCSSEYCTYVEFDQGEQTSAGYKKEFLDMLSKKYQFTFLESMKKKPNISLLAGSNDYISLNFYEQIIKSYKKEKCQVYGFGPYFKDGLNNASALLPIFKEVKEEHMSNMGPHHEDAFKYIWWIDCTFRSAKPFMKARNIMYGGGTIGYNDHYYENYILKDCELFNCITWDEATMEGDMVIKMKENYNIDVEKVFTKNCFFVNQKAEINTKISLDITGFGALRKEIKKLGMVIQYHDLNPKIRETFSNEYGDEILKFGEE